MCKVGDIILINNFKIGNQIIPKHSFIVISDENGQIGGMPFDFISVIMTSVKSTQQEMRKLGYAGNFYINNSNTNTIPNNGKDGIAMTDIFYYFNKSKITYANIGNLNSETINELIDFINTSEHDITENTDNL